MRSRETLGASAAPKTLDSPPGEVALEEETLSNTKMRLIEARMMEECYEMGNTCAVKSTEGPGFDENNPFPSNISERFWEDPQVRGALVFEGTAEQGTNAGSMAVQLAYNMGKSSLVGASSSPSMRTDPGDILAEMTSSLATLGDWKMSREKSIEEFAALYSSRVEKWEADGGEEGGFEEDEDEKMSEILFSLDTTKREALKETMDSASNLKRILENSKNRRVLPPPPSAAADESVIESGEVKLNKLRLDLQCEEWGRKGTVFTGAIDGIEVDPVARANEARIRELEKELLEMEAFKGGKEVESMEKELTTVFNKLDALAARSLSPSI